MPNLSELMGKIFGPGLVPRLQQHLDPQNITGGQMARTPSFVPESVGKEIGAKMGGVVPKLSKPAPIPTEPGIDPGPLTPKRMGGMVFEPSTAPVETAQAMPNPAINPIPRESILGIRHPNKMVDQVRQNAMYDPVERGRFDFLTRGDNPAGDLHGKARLINALQSALAGAAGGYQATGDIGGLIGGAGAGLAGGAISPMGGRNLQFEVSQRPQAEQRMAREMAMRRAQREQQVADTKMQHDQAMVEIQKGNAQLAKDKLEHDKTRPVPVGTNGLYVNGEIVGQRSPAEARPPAPRWQAVDDGQGSTVMVDLNAPENKGKTFRPPAKTQGGMTPSQSATFDHQQRQDATRAFQQWQKLRQDAIQLMQEGRQQEGEEALNQANLTAEQIMAQYGDLFDISGQGGWSWVQPKQGTARQKPTSAPVGKGLTLGQLKQQYLR